MGISVVRSVVDVAVMVVSVSRTVFAALEPTDVAVADDDSAVTTLAVVVVVVGSTNSWVTVNFGAVEPDVCCEGDVNCSVDAMVEEEIVEEVDDDDDEDDDDGCGGCGGGVVWDAFSVTYSSGSGYG